LAESVVIYLESVKLEERLRETFSRFRRSKTFRCPADPEDFREKFLFGRKL